MKERSWGREFMLEGGVPLRLEGKGLAGSVRKKQTSLLVRGWLAGSCGRVSGSAREG